MAATDASHYADLIRKDQLVNCHYATSRERNAEIVTCDRQKISMASRFGPSLPQPIDDVHSAPAARRIEG